MTPLFRDSDKAIFKEPPEEREARMRDLKRARVSRRAGFFRRLSRAASGVVGRPRTPFPPQ